MNVSFGTRFTDLCYGYNAFWADLIPLLDLPDHELVRPAGSAMLWGDGFEIETLINCRFAGAGLTITEVAQRRARAAVRRVQPARRLRRYAGAAHAAHRARQGQAQRGARQRAARPNSIVEYRASGTMPP